MDATNVVRSNVPARLAHQLIGFEPCQLTQFLICAVEEPILVRGDSHTEALGFSILSPTKPDPRLDSTRLRGGVR